MKDSILEKLRFVESDAAERAYFVEMCPKHLAEFHEQIKQA